MKRTATAAMLLAAALASALAQPTAKQVPPQIAPFDTAAEGAPPAPWRLVTAPKIARHSRYEVVPLDGARVLRLAADVSYANLLHPIDRDVSATPLLRWRWRVDRVPAGADLTNKSGDDVAARVCVSFDVPGDRLSIGVRLQLALGRRMFDPQLPAATLCYVWDTALPTGTWLPNAYTDRVQMLVVRGRGNTLGAWHEEARNVAADFTIAFPRESGAARGAALPLPAVAAVLLGTDADDTGSSTLAYIGSIAFAPR
jgi:hypothetical protein